MRDTYLADLAEQVEWESGCVERRIERYRLATTQVRKHCDGTSTRVEAELGDTTPGQRILQELMPPLVEGVEAARQEAIEN